jgi:hypothetical protein
MPGSIIDRLINLFGYQNTEQEINDVLGKTVK